MRFLAANEDFTDTVIGTIDTLTWRHTLLLRCIFKNSFFIKCLKFSEKEAKVKGISKNEMKNKEELF